MADKLIGSLGSLVLGALVIMLIGENFRGKVVHWFRTRVWRIWLLPGLLLAYNAFLVLITDSWNTDRFMILCWYFLPLTAALFAWQLMSFPDAKDYIMPVVIVVLLWIPVEVKYVFKSWEIGGIDYPLVALSAAIYALITLPMYGKDDISLAWKFRKEDLVFTMKVFLVLAAVMIPLTLATGFTKLGVHAKVEKHPWMLPLIWFSPALVEEIIFRAGIQNSFVGWLKRFGNIGIWIGIIIAAGIFGLAHANNRTPTGFGRDGPNWHYVFFAGVAGVAYGYVNKSLKARNSLNALGLAATIHAAVDITWVSCFGGK